MYRFIKNIHRCFTQDFSLNSDPKYFFYPLLHKLRIEFSSAEPLKFKKKKQEKQEQIGLYKNRIASVE
jgi:hypothetical protein